ncbi:TonB-dependent receptor [Archangium sp.]|jgi:TonB-dependent receptor|uniref:TonB-dependent receptor n=1 Tax=Archangium sp. TaxID=1872627 RepID=UPI002ED89D92
MRLKTFILCSMSIALLTADAFAQTGAPAQAADAGQPQADAGVVAETYEPAPDEYVEEIVVVGLQRSMQKAQTVKRDSDQIVDTVVAQDIGKLPDVTVSETAARIPGVQVDRARGEAQGQVLVRGLPDLTTTYNGREIFTAETRSVALADFPAGGIASLDVYKSTTADQLEGGLAGLIDVRSRRPLDFEGFEISGALRGTYANQSGRFDPNGNLLVTNRWKTGAGDIGALINVSYTRLNYLDSARWNTGFIGTGTSADTGEQFRFPDVVGIFYGAGQRERPSVNGSVQWRPQPGLEFYVDGLWQGYRDNVSDRILEMRLWGGGSRYTNVKFRPGTTDQAQSLTVENAARPFMFQGATLRETDTYQLAVGGAYEVGPLRLTADVARTDSRFDMSLYSFDQELASSPTFDVNFDVPRGPGGMEFSLQNFDLTDRANFRYLGFFDRSYVAAGDDWQARTDLDLNTGVSFIPKLEAGFRFTTRDAFQENGQRYGTPAAGTPLSEIPVELHEFRGGFRGSDIQGTRTWIVPTYDSIRSNVEQLRSLQGFAPGVPERLSVFDANEQTFSGYGQARYEFKVADVRVDGVVGLRAVRTNTSLTTFPSLTTTLTDDWGYTDLLPNASARLRLIPGLQLRLSASKTRTRPSFEQLRPAILDAPPPCLADPNAPRSCQVTGRGGNPDLKPVRSNNYDATLEYYFLQTGMASLAVFRRDFNGFITNVDVTRDDPVYGPGRVRVNIPVNGDGSIQGFEASLGSFFDFLPGWASGFGVYGNVTYLDDKQYFPEGIELQQGEAGRIPGVSRWSYNLVAMYEREKFSARLAFNQRSPWITSYVQDPQGAGFTGEFVERVSRLDFSGSYSPWEKVSFTLDASNILGNPFRNFRRFTPEGATYPRDVRYEESIYSLGVRVRI